MRKYKKMSIRVVEFHVEQMLAASDTARVQGLRLPEKENNHTDDWSNIWP